MSGGDWSAAPAREPGHVDETALGREARPASAGSAAGPAVGRVHGRPAPEYGEYAPEGWVNPVLEAQRREDERRAQERREEQPTATAQSAAAAQQVPRSRFGASPLDFGLTVGLLALGFWTVLGTFDTGQTASRTRAMVEERFTTMSDPSTMSLAAVLIALSGVVVLALTAWWAVACLRRRKRSAWVPLLGGALWMVTGVVVLTAVVLADPSVHAWFVEHRNARAG